MEIKSHAGQFNSDNIRSSEKMSFLFRKPDPNSTKAVIDYDALSVIWCVSESKDTGASHLFLLLCNSLTIET